MGRWLAIGAIFDFVFGIGILAFTKPLASLLDLPLPVDPTYLALNGVLLTILAGIYLAASFDPERYRAVAPISGCGRILGCVLFAWVFWGTRAPAFAWFSILDLTLGAATLAAWRRATALSD